LQELKKCDTLKDIPLIFYTASYTEKEDEKLAMDMGAVAFIRKRKSQGILLNV